LLGTTLGSLNVDLSYSGRQPYLSAAAPIGVPADLLRIRPDIRAAERNYAAAVSEVTVAQAARYPSLSLSGQISAPLDGGGSTNAIGAGLILPLFNQPGLAAQVDANISRASQAYLKWRILVLSAVGDVETSLAAVESSRRVVNAAQKSLNLNLEALRLSKDLYNDGGLVTVIELLDSERAVTTARSTVAEALRTYATDIISLYVALGVGIDGPAT
jgi:multidrug efflux system outer membrane protein